MNATAFILPIRHAAAVTPHDTSPLTNGVTRGIYVGVSGDLTIIHESGVTMLYTSLAAGFYHPIAATVIKSTGTTATNIVAGY